MSLATMPSPNHYNYPPLDNMSALTDARPYMANDRDYQMPEYEHHDSQQDQPRYPSPPTTLVDNPYAPQTQVGDLISNGMGVVSENKDESDVPSPGTGGRTTSIPKPDREITKDKDGKFYCNWPGCTEEVQTFGRKCEWSKHMDKHDRPYKCPAEGCEKLPGFTYSGGLLRHEREVHNKHGGPKKTLNCPHNNCKRNKGKGFSRQENLNEHLRRVHTGVDGEENGKGEETEEDGGEIAGNKRKRSAGGEGDATNDEMKRLRDENNRQRNQIAELSRQVYQLQQQNQTAAFTQALAAAANGQQKYEVPAAHML